MNENLNLLEILKDCPKGTKFYSRFLGSVEFCKITLDNYIEVIGKNGYYIGFKPNGTYQHSEESAEIDLFPSKDQRDWSKWHKPFKDGDIVYGNNNCCTYISIYKSDRENNSYNYHASLTLYGGFKINNYADKINLRIATEEEKQKLFDAIKANGYKWNPETKTLEKLKKEKFDPKTLRPFDKVLVRDFSNQKWTACLFSHIDNDAYHQFKTSTALGWYHCIPFNEDTKHLVGKMDEAPEFYRYRDE